MTPLDGALAALAAGWSVFPCRGKLPAIPKPLGRGCHDATTDRETVERWAIEYPDCNWGVGCGPSGLLVVDIDPKTGGTSEVIDQLPPTLTVRTPSGGWHCYFRGQSANRVGLTTGVDIRSTGGYVVLPGSSVAGAYYSVERTLPVAEAPAWLVAAIGAPRSVVTQATTRIQGDAPAAEDVAAIVEAFTAAGPPKSGGHDVLFCVTEILARGTWPDEHVVRTVGHVSVAIGRPESEGLRTALDHLSNREAGRGGRYGKPKLTEIYGLNAGALVALLDPPAPLAVTAPPPSPAPSPSTWTLLEGSLMGAPQTVERALRSYRAQHTRRDPGTVPELGASSAVIKWLVSAKGWDSARVGSELGAEAGDFAISLAKPEVQTVGRLTRIDQLLAGHELRWNEMALCIEIDGDRWSDNHTAQARLALEQTGACDPEKPIPNGDIEQRARALAAPYHPVEEYLAALPAWDGVARVDGLWPTYFGADDTALNRKLSACFALGAVRRVLEPGAKVDMMPILYGNQGEFKSSGLSALVGGDPFFTDAAPGFGHRSENAMTLAGCWVWEIAEMQGMDRADQNAVKAFVSRQADDVLLPYARAKTRMPRRSVAIGTTNVEDCLTDPTGSRRHPVIAIGAVDRDGMVRDRDQFWAEVLHRVRAGEPHWLEKADELAMGTRNAANHMRRDEALIAALVAWFMRLPERRFMSPRESATGFKPRDAAVPASFTIPDALAYAFDGKAEAWRVGLALKQLGLASRRVGKAKVTTYDFPDPAGF